MLYFQLPGRSTPESVLLSPELEKLFLAIGEREADNFITWNKILSGLFEQVKQANAYLSLLPKLHALRVENRTQAASLGISEGQHIYEIEADLVHLLVKTVDAVYQMQGGERKEDSLPEAPTPVSSIHFLFEFLLAFADLARNSSDELPNYQDAPLEASRIEMLAFELLLLGGGKEYEKNYFYHRAISCGLLFILPTAEQPGQTIEDIRLRQEESGWAYPLILPDTRTQETPILDADNPWAPGLTDRSGAGREVAAFATMFTASNFTPPLAVGVFGDWGTGKSFFLRMLHDEVGRLVREAARQDPSPGSKPKTLEHVVQIHFNAWHYAEENLWASIVDKIFTELDAWLLEKNKRGDKVPPTVTEQLTISRKLAFEAAENLIQARKAERAAQTRLEKAEEVLEEKRKAIAQDKSSWLKAAFKTVLETKENKESLAEIADLLKLDDLSENIEAFQAAHKKLQSDFSITLAMVNRFLTTGTCMFAGLLLCLVLLPIISATLIPQILKVSPFDMVEEGAAITAGLSGILASLTTGIAFIGRKVASVKNTLTRFDVAFQAECERKASEYREKEEQAKIELHLAAESVKHKEQAFLEASKVAENAKARFLANEPQQRLANFVRERLASGDYARELSFIATVRKDFEQLSNLMTDRDHHQPKALFAKGRGGFVKEITALLDKKDSALTAKEKEELQRLTTPPKADLVTFNRIILYIDDLDRCPGKQVVAVLQAIHLLLAFPLFVVVVAVDTRWVLQALESNYDQFLKDTEGSATSMDYERSPAMRYMEKIIQIPYRVRKNWRQAEGSLIVDRLSKFIAEPDEEQQDNAGEEPRSPDTASDDEGDNGGKDVVVTGGGLPASDQDQTIGLELSRDQLKLSAEEVQFLHEIDKAQEWSPRRSVRFANSYLLLRAVADLETLGVNEKHLAICLACIEKRNPQDEFLALCQQKGLQPPEDNQLAELLHLTERYSFKGINNQTDAKEQGSAANG